jgi:hypothetical protein
MAEISQLKLKLIARMENKISFGKKTMMVGILFMKQEYTVYHHPY